MDTILCDEPIQEVFHRLPPPSSSTLDVSLVSKRWFRVYRSSKTTLSFHLSPSNSTPSPSPLSSPTSLTSPPSLSTPAPSDAVSTFSDDLLLSQAESSPPPLQLGLSLPSALISLSSSCPHRPNPSPLPPLSGPTSEAPSPSNGFLTNARVSHSPIDDLDAKQITNCRQPLIKSDRKREKPLFPCFRVGFPATCRGGGSGGWRGVGEMYVLKTGYERVGRRKEGEGGNDSHLVFHRMSPFYYGESRGN